MVELCCPEQRGVPPAPGRSRENLNFGHASAGWLSSLTFFVLYGSHKHSSLVDNFDVGGGPTIAYLLSRRRRNFAVLLPTPTLTIQVRVQFFMSWLRRSGRRTSITTESQDRAFRA